MTSSTLVKPEGGSDPMAYDFVTIARRLSRVLKESAQAVGIYDHRTPIGDGREDLVRQLLVDLVGTTFGVTKAEVVDTT